MIFIKNYSIFMQDDDGFDVKSFLTYTAKYFVEIYRFVHLFLLVV
jgi:hypothetical protein